MIVTVQYTVGRTQGANCFSKHQFNSFPFQRRNKRKSKPKCMDVCLLCVKDKSLNLWHVWCQWNTRYLYDVSDYMKFEDLPYSALGLMKNCSKYLLKRWHIHNKEMPTIIYLPQGARINILSKTDKTCQLCCVIPGFPSVHARYGFPYYKSTEVMSLKPFYGEHSVVLETDVRNNLWETVQFSILEFCWLCPIQWEVLWQLLLPQLLKCIPH